MEGNFWRSKLLVGVATSDWFDYQISGAVGCVLNLNGQIDAERLLNSAKEPNNIDAVKVRCSAAEISDLKIGGCIMADSTGFGKTKQMLFATYFHVILNLRVLCKPTFIVVPPSLISYRINRHWFGA